MKVDDTLIEMYKKPFKHMIALLPENFNRLKKLEGRIIKLTKNDETEISTVFINSVMTFQHTPDDWNKSGTYIQIDYQWFEYDQFQGDIIATDSSLTLYIQYTELDKIDEMLMKLEYDL